MKSEMKKSMSRSIRTEVGSRQKDRGAAIIGVLFFILITSILLMGVGTFAVSHQTRMRSDLNYAQALDVAEAGIDAEFRKLTLNSTSADQAPGMTYTFGQGAYKVYCTNKDGTTPWTPQQYLYVIATGTVNGVSRTVKVASKGYQPEGNYAIYTMDSISVWNGASAEVNGDLGTNGQFHFSSHPTINGGIYFNGPAAGWSGSDPGGYTESRTPKKIDWQTVDEIANAKFPSGGLTWLATHNDNAAANPPIIGNSITSSVTLKTGDYYITDMNLTGNDKITFDNTNGPVNIWIGPAGGSSLAKFRGGTAAISTSANPDLANHVYVATRGGIDLAGNEEFDGLVYAYNKDSLGNAYGYATNSGNPVVNGQIISNQYDLNGNITINYTKDLIKPTSFGYYGYDNSWLEVNPR